MATTTRIYRVTDKSANTTTMVESSSPAAAVRAVAAGQFDVEVCSASEALTLAAAGTPLLRPEAEGDEAGNSTAENTAS